VALQVERQFTKDEILELYLNQIFLGISANGVEAASQQYFGKSLPRH
jgi:penicillin-binding protein 1A